jgi:hypothetical protein
MKFPIKNIQFFTALLALAAIYAGCTKGPDIKSYTYPAPEPKAMFPDSGYAGFADVTINGAQFGDYKNAVKVFFNGILADTVLSCEDSKIVVRVPANAVSGKVSLQVWTNTIDSIGDFTIVPAPLVTGANKDIGLTGEAVEIYGKGFGSDLTKVVVNFNGTTSTVSELTDTLIKVIVPAGFSSGNISVAVNNYTVPGPVFRAVATVPNPIYWLSFEGNLTDNMGGASATYTYKDSGKPIGYNTGVNGQAVKLEGTYNFTSTNNQVLALPTQLTKQKELTVTCWVNWTNDSTAWVQEPIFDAGLARGTRLCLMTRMNTSFGTGYQNMIGRLVFENINGFGSATYFNAVGKGPLPSKEWHHVAMVVSQADHIEKIYMDGIEVGSVVLPVAADQTVYNHNKVYIGCPTNGVVKEPSFGGMIDEFQIYNQALNADQIFAVYYKHRP